MFNDSKLINYNCDKIVVIMSNNSGVIKNQDLSKYAKLVKKVGEGNEAFNILEGHQIISLHWEGVPLHRMSLIGIGIPEIVFIFDILSCPQLMDKIVAILERGDIVKVIHGSDLDNIDIRVNLRSIFGITIKNIFDIQLAFRNTVRDVGKIKYNQLCYHFGLQGNVRRGQINDEVHENLNYWLGRISRSNKLRPLQIESACADTFFLLEIYVKLSHMIKDLNVFRRQCEIVPPTLKSKTKSQNQASSFSSAPNSERGSQKSLNKFSNSNQLSSSNASIPSLMDNQIFPPPAPSSSSNNNSNVRNNYPFKGNNNNNKNQQAPNPAVKSASNKSIFSTETQYKNNAPLAPKPKPKAPHKEVKPPPPQPQIINISSSTAVDEFDPWAPEPELLMKEDSAKKINTVQESKKTTSTDISRLDFYFEVEDLIDHKVIDDDVNSDWAPEPEVIDVYFEDVTDHKIVNSEWAPPIPEVISGNDKNKIVQCQNDEKQGNLQFQATANSSKFETVQHMISYSAALQNTRQSPYPDSSPKTDQILDNTNESSNSPEDQNVRKSPKRRNKNKSKLTLPEAAESEGQSTVSMPVSQSPFEESFIKKLNNLNFTQEELSIFKNKKIDQNRIALEDLIREKIFLLNNILDESQRQAENANFSNNGAGERMLNLLKENKIFGEIKRANLMEESKSKTDKMKRVCLPQGSQTLSTGDIIFFKVFPG